MARQERDQQSLQVGGAVLAVRIDQGDQVGATAEGGLAAGGQGGALAEVQVVAEHRGPPLRGDRGGGVGGAVVDDDHVHGESRQARGNTVQDGGDPGRLVAARDHHCESGGALGHLAYIVGVLPSADYVALSADPYSAHRLVLARCAGARTVLDAGCSAGALARELAAAGVVVDGIESDAGAAEVARSVCRRVLVGDLETMELDLPLGAYDRVLLADVIEHLREPAAAMARLRPLLAPAGRLVVSTPNIANWSMRLLHLAGRWDYRERGIMDATHVRFFTRRTLLSALEAAGYRVVELDVSCPLPVLRREPFNRAAHWLGLRWKNLLAYQFVAVAEAVA